MGHGVDARGVEGACGIARRTNQRVTKKVERSVVEHWQPGFLAGRHKQPVVERVVFAPDYVYVHASKEDALLAQMKETLAAFYGKTEEARRASTDFCRMVDEGQFARVNGLLERSVASGA